ncbi:ABC transporter substrate-binding protein [Cytobacillus firmus]|uniref:ABC transporter substrate-binding protein n=1 Tax=Cytobacillus firmus TaxID=1399 RepID=UPI001C8D8A47|nr:ABC transporter substrate-binding protein [Cytobacillus firmus]MBX9975811.1 ABC transporter substrate-binding protein [Cytobacillus firmus]
MKKTYVLASLAFACSIGLAACSSSEESSVKEASSKQTEQKAEAELTEQNITYLGKDYSVPAEISTLAAASLESMEDAAILGVKPAGAITVGGELPEYLAEDLQGAKSIGEKTQPNYETLLEMKPDVILGTSKFQPDVAEQLNKVATMFPVSHVSTDWEDNLRLMAELTGKQDQADQIINQYKEDAQDLKAKAEESLKDKKVITIRVRGGSLFLYPESVYFNPVLYSDLGLSVPEEIKAVKAQEMIPLEKLAEMNPDYIFLQFAENENAENPAALDELTNNPIWKSIEAAKNDNVFVNAVDPMAQGGTAWSKTAFLKAAGENLFK